MDMIKTDKTYATRENAVKALAKALAQGGLTLDTAKWMIATNEAGRFAPVLWGREYVDYALQFHFTVVG